MRLPRAASEPGGVCESRGGTLGQCGEKLDYRSGPVRGECFDGALLRDFDLRFDSTNALNHVTFPVGTRP